MITFPKSLAGELYQDISLSRFTSWRVGGKAKYLYKPAAVEDLVRFLRICENDIPLLWLGLGSNTLVREGGFAGIVILTFLK